MRKITFRMRERGVLMRHFCAIVQDLAAPVLPATERREKKVPRLRLPADAAVAVAAVSAAALPQWLLRRTLRSALPFVVAVAERRAVGQGGRRAGFGRSWRFCVFLWRIAENNS